MSAHHVMIFCYSSTHLEFIARSHAFLSSDLKGCFVETKNILIALFEPDGIWDFFADSRIF